MKQSNPFAHAAQRRRHPALAMALLLLTALTACQAIPIATPAPGAVQPAPQPRPPETPPRQPLHLVLLHTNDTWGYLWPCG